MKKDRQQLESSDLFGRVVSILETARTNVVRSVNSEMVTAYWLIGREHYFPNRQKNVLKAQHILALGKAHGRMHASRLALKGQHNKAIVLPLQGKWVVCGWEPWALPKAELFSTFGTLCSHAAKFLLRKERFLIEEAVAQYGAGRHG